MEIKREVAAEGGRLRLLKEHFLKSGYNEIPRSDAIPHELASKADLLFTNGREVVLIKTLLTEYIDQNSLLKVAMEAASLKPYVCCVYVAVSRVYKTILDGALFKSQGLGVLVVDEAVVEALKPEVGKGEIMGMREVRAPEEGLGELRNAMRQLESRIGRLEREMKELRRMIIEVPIPAEGRAESVSEPSLGEEALPSYLEDNPWLETLRNMGRVRRE